MIGERKFIKANPSLQDTIKLIFSQLLAKSKEVAWMLDEYELRDPDPLEAARKIHQFTRNNIKYVLDPKGFEAVRSAAQSWADRLIGIDCEDLTIFQTSLMIEQGHGGYVWLTIVDLDPIRPGMEHIYPSIVPANMARPKSSQFKGEKPIGIAFDSLLKFGQHPKGIVMTMQLIALGGLDNNGQRSALGNIDHLTGATRRKAEWVMRADGASRRAVAAIMPYVEDITSTGMVIWKRGTNPNVIADLIDRNSRGDLGAVRRRDGNRNNDKKKKEEKPRNVVQVAARIFPALILGRNAFLAMVALNAGHLASHLRIIFMNPEVAKKSNYDPVKFAKAAAQRPKIEKAWKNLGGELEALKKAIAKGAHVPASRLNGLGLEPVSTATLAASAVPVLAVIVPLVASIDFKEMGGSKVENADGTATQLDGQKLASGINKIIKAVKDKRKPEEAAFDKSVEDLAAGNEVGKDPKRQDDEPKSNTLLYVLLGLGGLAAVGGGILLFSNSSNKKKK